MATPASLTEVGLLYEGSDFDQWEATVRIRLRVEGLEDMLLPSDVFHSFSKYLHGRLAFDIIRLQISPQLRKRVEWTPQLSPAQLFGLLKTLVQPFRLLDLPAELRTRIHDYALPEESFVDFTPLQESIFQWPSIIAASRQLRAEALPLLYSQRTMSLDFVSDGHSSVSEEEEERAYDLAKGIKTCISSEGKLMFTAASRSDPQSNSRFTELVEITFSPSDGLAIEITNEDDFSLSTESRKLLKKHVKKTEEIRSMLGPQGEAILLALTSDESLWEEGCLQAD